MADSNMIMPYWEGSAPPDDIAAGPEAQAEWERCRTILAALRGQRRKDRRTAVEVVCGCGKRHLLLSIHPVSQQELAVWSHGGGTIPPPSPEDPFTGRLAGKVGWLRATDALVVVPDEILGSQLRLASVRGRCLRGGRMTMEESDALVVAVMEYRDSPRRRMVFRLQPE